MHQARGTAAAADARWRRQPADVHELVGLQRELLLAALRLVRPGGVVSHVTCSPPLAETVGVVVAVVRRMDTEQLDARALFSGGYQRSGTARTCSSGRTGTAPTPCSARCSGNDPTALVGGTSKDRDRLRSPLPDSVRP